MTILGSADRMCDGVPRREFLQIGGLGATGLALPDLLRARARGSASPAPGAGRARSCILLFMGGSPPQMDTFDPKPDAPAEARGQFPPVATSVPGTRIRSLLPSLSKRSARYAIIRSVSDEYTGSAHGQSVYLALTGHKNPRVKGDDVRPALDDYPCMGSAVPRLRGAPNALPSALPPTSGSSVCTAGRSPARAAATPATNRCPATFRNRGANAA